ncbi:hypothetical protein [Streptomyces europaeiscabiei]|uniref:hypothetical protein n=1 Tax=Streptomyces europaeiscabiei TaxID=146819 RepID=UPI0029BDFAEA|nr:hypothetical protein [Streptomyces europaeiscabiei]MDX3782793.1 hypothetical protein [Streptomyces europaeiscabiei]MDX3843435.1 hypothetical protein [Streptomyces europaeiscabiei]MDX3862982.1 hypothetical protein [Streptomyces europaeiscabiei]MDX3871926.1 hypothetical protein [Streptomyces europaeiscabiei]
MISTRRIVAAVGLAVGVTGLAAPMANADATADVTRFNPMTALDSLAADDLPEEQKETVPRPSQQLKSLNQVHELNRLSELHQVTDMAAPALGLLGAVQ